MNVKLVFRLLVDGAMLLLTIALMAYTLVENELHELFGILFFVLYFLHQALSIKWYRGLLKGKCTLRCSINTAVDGVLTVEILALIASSMMISELTIYDDVQKAKSTVSTFVNVLCVIGVVGVVFFLLLSIFLN